MDDVLVVGAGPVGLTMAAELARHRTRCRIIDRLAQPLPYCRAIGVTPRTLEVWEDMGIAREMIDAGLWIDGLRSIIHGHAPKDNLLELDELPYGELGLPQYETERLLARHLSQFGIEVERSVTLAALDQRERDVQVRLDRADGTAETATFRAVVGCDGAHSAVRRALGIPFEGEAFPMMFMLGDVHIDWGLPRGMALRALRLVENARAGHVHRHSPPRARPLPGIDARTGGARGSRRHRPRHSIRASRPAAPPAPIGGQRPPAAKTKTVGPALVVDLSYQHAACGCLPP
jgi:2-polyprenyl-6-methoxyphenol hydroxylase-like FAD-dependent oxidoreductase